eukprot:CAMPEP_0119287568 /NCGR_PEP_ID=MMETSP1329-20130426/35781_1 /TAXON_ID=114041 /ORGANISM="Genus nov. species nov., Strain RCC1024" /LENGTH=747 /DNA_ID=CAMNT_0007288327 /DNA_START=131 /DNA_END=2371 /DNA_ORIENTATION=+
MWKALTFLAATALALAPRRPKSLSAPQKESCGTPQHVEPPLQLSRRDAGALAAIGITTVAAQALAADDLIYVPVANDAYTPVLAFKRVEDKYGLRFTEYLARLLLNYDPSSKEWWEARRREASGFPTADAREAKRMAAYAEFVASAELSLARSYLDDAGTERLFDALNSRVAPRTIAGRRQLALLAALSERPLAPTENLVKASQNGTVLNITMEDAGEGYGSTAPKVTAADPAQRRFDDSKAPVLRARMRPTGRVLKVVLTSGGAGYDGLAPTARAPPPPLGGVQAKLNAVVVNGTVKKIVVEDPGSGYDPSGKATVILAPPRSGGLQATASVAWEYEVDAVDVEGGGSGFWEDGRVDLAFQPPKEGGRAARATASVGRCGCAVVKLQAGDFTSKADNLTRLLPAALAPQRKGLRYVVAEAEAVRGNKTGVDALFGPRSKDFVDEERVTPAQYGIIGVAGAVCTAAAHGVLTPLELVKTRIQTSGGAGAPLGVAREIVAEAGPGGLMLGAEPIFVGYFVNGFLGFGLTELFKRRAGLFLPEDAAWAATVVGSLGAAVFAVASVTPFEAAKVRMQKAGGSDQRMTAVWGDLIRERGGVYEGLFGRSLGPLIAKDVVFSIFKFTVFDAARDGLFGAFPEARDASLGVLLVSLGAGAIAGACGALVSQPLDTTFARVETSSGDVGILGAARSIFDEGGPLALYAGAVTRMVFAATLIAIEFAIFEALRDAFHVSRDDFSYALDALATAVA